ncbi:MAG: hypothetical protein D6790_20325 [Caldilineae bacterium]|nr:MAG: hypothetical protein D6790_20325 [Caldilineae bacterium]
MSKTKVECRLISGIDVADYYDIHEYEGQPVWSSGLIRQALGAKMVTQERSEELRRQLVTDKGHALELLLDHDSVIEWRDHIVAIDGPLNTVGSRMLDAWQEGLDEESWFQRYLAIEREQGSRNRKEATARRHFEENLDKVMTYIEARATNKIVIDAADLEWISDRIGEVAHRYPWAMQRCVDQQGILFEMHLQRGSEERTIIGKALIDRVVNELPDGDKNDYGIIDFKCSGLPATQWRSVMRRQRIDVQLTWYAMAFHAAFQERATPYVVFVGNGWDRAVRISERTMHKALYGYDTESVYFVEGTEDRERYHHDGIVDVFFRKQNQIDEY